MSLIIFIFYIIGIPLAIGLIGKKVFSRVENPAQKIIVVTLCIGMFTGLIWLTVGEKWLADRQVRELCAKDGGVKVYETVKLTAEEYDELKQKNFILSDKFHRKPMDEYYLKSEHKLLKKGDPKLLRSHAWVVRRSDSKIIGESVHYARSGGELPGPWHGSSFHCPEIRKENPSLETSIFIRGAE